MTEQHTGPQFGEALEGRQFVRFSLAGEEYAVDAVNVREIVKLGRIRRVPHLPDFFRGVINLRGTIIPVIDLRLRFGIGEAAYHDHTCIVITEFSGGVIGLIVEEVSDVVRLPAGSISGRPSLGTAIRTDFIEGVSNLDDEMIIILDVERILSDHEVQAFRESQEVAAEPEEPAGE